jgi:SulP family sulfate permease
VVVLGITSRYGIDGLFTCTMLAGVILLIMGVTRVGAMVKYFPRPVVVGFTDGIAILIAGTQIRDFFGPRMEHVLGDFFHRMGAIAENFYTLNWAATIAGVTCLTIMITCVLFFKKVPARSWCVSVRRRPWTCCTSHRSDWHAICKSHRRASMLQ